MASFLGKSCVIESIQFTMVAKSECLMGFRSISSIPHQNFILPPYCNVEIWLVAENEEADEVARWIRRAKAAEKRKPDADEKAASRQKNGKGKNG